jgi:hypothetical protein
MHHKLKIRRLVASTDDTYTIENGAAIVATLRFHEFGLDDLALIEVLTERLRRRVKGGDDAVDMALSHIESAGFYLRREVP